MHAGKPDLANVLRRNMFLVPPYRVKSSPLVVDGERVTGSFDIFVREVTIGQFEWPNPLANAPSHLVDRCTVGSHRVPKTQELDLYLVRFGFFGRYRACAE